jgi:uncharacterized membrane protein YbhN (UPF0104 family)
LSHRPRWWSAALRALLVLAALGLVGYTFRDVDPSRALGLISARGPRALLVLLPFIAALGADTLGWRWILRSLGRPVRFLSLYGVRMCSEAVLTSLPGGAVVAESLKPVLVERRCGVPIPEGVASVAASKCLVALTHGVYLGLSVLLAFRWLSSHSVALIGVSGLGFIAALAALVLGGGAALAALILLGGSVAARIHAALTAIPLGRVRAWLVAREERFHETDRHLGRTLTAGRLAGPALCFLAQWLLEAVETYIILRLLGVELAYTQVMCFESILSVVRSVVFFLPAGLGVQDVGYVAFLGALGVAEPLTIGAAFVLVKRLKELLWIVSGYLLLFAGAPRKAERHGGGSSSSVGR